TVDLDGKRLSSFDATAPNLPERKNWTEPIREGQRPTHGYIGLQNHDPGDVVWFKEVSVRPLASLAPGLPALAAKGTLNSIGMTLVHLPAGEFTMGSPPQEKGRRVDEPQRCV